jgi:hypothetical protein
VIPKKIASIVLLLEFEALDHSPHRAIKDHDPLSEQINDIERI